MRRLATGLISLVGLVNALPLVGAVSATRLEALYGVPLSDPNLVILLRHRAVLFGIVGGLLLWAAFRPALRPVAGAAGLLSMLSFVAFVVAAGGANPPLERVAWIDGVASLALATALVLGGSSRTPPSRGGAG